MNDEPGDADPNHCTLPPYGKHCAPWDASKWTAALRLLAPVVRENSPSGQKGVNFMGGIHPRLKRPVGRRLAVAALSLLNKKKRESEGGPAFLTGPTIAGCSTFSSFASSASSDASSIVRTNTAASSLEIKFNSDLLAGDSILLQPTFAGTPIHAMPNMSGWSGSDSLSMMVCVEAAKPPKPTTCTESCEQAGFNCLGTDSTDQQPSCDNGCLMGNYLVTNGKSPTLKGATTLEQCQNSCLTFSGNCGSAWKYNETSSPFTIETCGGCRCARSHTLTRALSHTLTFSLSCTLIRSYTL
jgi:hypothetical protein